MRVGLAAALLLLPRIGVAQEAILQGWTHAVEVERSGPQQREYQLGLGALQKIGGRWRHKQSEVIAGELTRITWQVAEGYTAEEAYDGMAEQLPEQAQLLFECMGRACGSSAQWADRVFNQRLLYGHDQRQRYSAWRWEEGAQSWTAVIYAVDRANRRHYLHLDLLKHSD